MSWTAILVLAAGAYAFKLLGVVAGNRLANPTVQRAIGLLPPALFAAVIMLQTFVDPDDATALTLDARVVGLAVAALAAWRRLPFIAVIVLAMLATAGVRLMV